MKKLGFNILVIGFLLFGTAFAEGACYRSKGYWEPTAADYVAQVKEQNNVDRYIPVQKNTWQECVTQAITEIQNVTNEENKIYFMDWEFKEPDTYVIVNKYKATMKGQAFSGTVDSGTNVNAINIGDQRYYSPGKTIWACIIRFVDQNGISQRFVSGEVPLKGTQDKTALTSGIFNPYLVFGKSEAEATSACKKKSAEMLVTNESFEAAKYSVTSSTGYLSSFSFMGHQDKTITQDEASDLLVSKNTINSKK